MKKYKIFYWKEVDDSKDWFERIIEAKSIDDALTQFRSKNPFSSIDSIELIIKDNFMVHKEIKRSIIENVFVTALEGGSNYWYYLPKEAVKRIREVVPIYSDPYLATAMLKAVLDHNVSVPIFDAENEGDEIGQISKDTMYKRLVDLYNDEGLRWTLEAEMNESGDAETSDVVFQFLTMGEYVYC